MADCTDNGFRALDEASYLDGYSFHAHTAKWMRSNANNLAVNLSARPFAFQSWPIHQIGTTDAAGVGYRLSALQWKPIAPAWVGMVGLHTKELRLRLYAKIEDTYTVYMHVGRAGDMPPADPAAAVAAASPQTKALVGDGTLKRYPTTGTWTIPVEAGRQAQIVVWLTSVDRIESGMTKGGGATYFDTGLAVTSSILGIVLPGVGDVSQLDGVSCNAAGEFTTADFYAWIGASGGAATAPIIGGGPRRIRRVDFGGTWLEVDGGWSAIPIGTAIYLCRGPWVQISDLSLTGSPITDDDLAAGGGGVPDYLGFARQKLTAMLPAAVLGETHAQYRMLRNLVCDNWIEPRRTDVNSTSYPAGAHARYPVEFSRPGNKVKLHAEVSVEGLAGAGRAYFQVQTVNWAGGGTVTADDAPIDYEAFVCDEAGDADRGFQIESRFGSPSARWGVCSMTPTINTGDETTYRQEVIVRVRQEAVSAGVGGVRIRGVRLWEEYDP